MKKLIVFVCIVVAFAECKQQVDWSTLIQGAYSMEEQSISQNDQQKSYKDLNQLKIYTPHHFMYAQLNPRDAVAGFGVGAYTVKGDTILEHSLYSGQGNSVDKTRNDFVLVVSKTPKGYKQVISNIQIGGISSTLTEFYTTTGKESVTTPIDGVWRETRSYLVNNGDTTHNNRVQYKTFFRGQFMFGNTVNPDTDSLFTGIGYGTFEVKGNGQLEETDLVSSYGVIAGFTFPVEYSMTDANHFVQTVDNQDGSIGVEFYERME